MKLDVSIAIRNPGQDYAFAGQQAIAAVEISGDAVTFDECEVRGTFQAMENGDITVDGSIVTTAHAPCANCLAPAEAKVENTFRETFVRNGDPEDDESYSYEGYLVDLDKLICDYAVLALPMRFLCREDCNGLRDYIDADDRVSLCREDEPAGQHPFAALQQLLDAKSGEDNKE